MPTDRSRRVIVVCAILLAPPLAAQVRDDRPARTSSRDDGPGVTYSKDEWPTELTRRPLTLAAGMAELTAPVNVNLSMDRVGEPVFLNPSLYYGVTSDLTVGVRHFTGLCVTGESNGCPYVYNDIGADSLWTLARTGALHVALGVSLDVFRIHDPTLLAVEGRIHVKWGSGPLAILFVPGITAGLTNRDTGVLVSTGFAQTATGNRESITIPLQVQLQIMPQLAVFGGVALSGPLDPPVGSFGDAYSIPVSFGALYAMSRRVDVIASMNFPALGGANSTADTRWVTGAVAFRL